MTTRPKNSRFLPGTSGTAAHTYLPHFRISQFTWSMFTSRDDRLRDRPGRSKACLCGG
jgi:hypothetical protein